MSLLKRDYKIISGGTDNHMMLIDLRNKDILQEKTLKQFLGLAEITVNKNMVPFDDKSPFVTSGISSWYCCCNYKRTKVEEAIWLK